jgi:prepilin-type N-terminal cleavage/methylation domain-containing protein
MLMHGRKDAMARISSKKSSAGGFTLVELIVVLVILAAVAALVVPKLGFVEAQAGNATAAAAGGELVSHLETAKLTMKSYPLGYDSLLEFDTTASAWQMYNKLWQHAAGPSFFGPKADLEPVTLATTSGSATATSPYLSVSLGHAISKNTAGNYYLFDHNATSTSPSSSATVRRDFTSWGGQTVARVKPTAGSWIRAAGYNDGLLPVGVHLLAFGVGPNLGTIGETIVSAPRHSEQKADFYGRYIAIFAAFENGKPAVLKAVVDSHGSTIEGNVSAYYAGGPEHK